MCEDLACTLQTAQFVPPERPNFWCCIGK